MRKIGLDTFCQLSITKWFKGNSSKNLKSNTYLEILLYMRKKDLQNPSLNDL